MPPTQIARALREMGIVWIPAHSPQAKGRVERQFLHGQDRLVKGMRIAGWDASSRPMHTWRKNICPGGTNADRAAGQATTPIGRLEKTTIWRRF